MPSASKACSGVEGIHRPCGGGAIGGGKVLHVQRGHVRVHWVERGVKEEVAGVVYC